MQKVFQNNPRKKLNFVKVENRPPRHSLVPGIYYFYVSARIFFLTYVYIRVIIITERRYHERNGATKDSKKAWLLPSPTWNAT